MLALLLLDFVKRGSGCCFCLPRKHCRRLSYVPVSFSIFHLKQKSLIRGTVLALGSLWVSFRISGFPDVRVCLWLILPLLVALGAAYDTGRCLQRRWNFYHGGVLLLLYVDLMIVIMILVLLLAPFSTSLF
jgi:hypothetical protein